MIFYRIIRPILLRFIAMLLLMVAGIFVAASPGMAVDWFCGEGRWVHIILDHPSTSSILVPYNYPNPDELCPGRYDSTISGNQRIDRYDHLKISCYDIITPCPSYCVKWLDVYEWRCCDDGNEKACVDEDGCPGKMTCMGGDWGKCESRPCCLLGEGK